jgi:hypothetical protein
LLYGFMFTVFTLAAMYGEGNDNDKAYKSVTVWAEF